MTLDHRIADPLSVEEDLPADYSSPGERCPVTDPFWCSRDRYHAGAHVNRAEAGGGMIGWPNTTEPVGFVTCPERPSLTIPLVLLCAVVGAVFVAVWWFRG